jgi:hypothetical protein
VDRRLSVRGALSTSSPSTPRFLSFQNQRGKAEAKSGAGACPNRPILGQPKTFFFSPRQDERRRCSGRSIRSAEEETEEDMEIEEDSSSTVTMLAAPGTFMADTVDGTVTETRNSQKVFFRKYGIKNLTRGRVRFDMTMSS